MRIADEHCASGDVQVLRCRPLYDGRYATRLHGACRKPQKKAPWSTCTRFVQRSAAPDRAIAFLDNGGDMDDPATKPLRPQSFARRVLHLSLAVDQRECGVFIDCY